MTDQPTPPRKGPGAPRKSSFLRVVFSVRVDPSTVTILRAHANRYGLSLGESVDRAAKSLVPSGAIGQTK